MNCTVAVDYLTFNFAEGTVSKVPFESIIAYFYR